MLISQALAQETPAAETTAEISVPATGAAPITPPNTTAIIAQNVGMVLFMVVLFYFLLIRPQQKRFKEHKEMTDGLKVGDRVVTAGGLLGNIDTLVSNDEVIVDLGNGVKVTSLRSMIQAKTDTSTKK